MLCVVAAQKNPSPRNTDKEGRHCTVDLLIKICCLVKKYLSILVKHFKAIGSATN
jgi:hypothetical protein